MKRKEVKEWLESKTESIEQIDIEKQSMIGEDIIDLMVELIKNHSDLSNVSISLRDQIAMQALTGMYASHANPNASSPQFSDVDKDAKHCYKIADALIKARSES